MRRIAISIVAALGVVTSLSAQTEEYRQYSGNLMAYPYAEKEAPAQTPAPEGYKPFHIEHYGRHGSRWLIGENDYAGPAKRLRKAADHGKLTPLGERTLAALERIDSASKGRLGELTDRGAEQHRGIGRRMALNYPEIFTDGASVDARSTVVIRCILSMFNGLEGIQSVAPGVSVKTDASEADMYYMNFNDKPAWKYKDAADAGAKQEYLAKHRPGTGYLDRLVSDRQFACDSVEPGLLPYLFWVLANTQGHHDQPWLLEEVFTPEEAKEIWRDGNASWFIHGGNTALTNGRMPYVQRNLLNNIIASADTAILSNRPGANLRYGHDGILLNIVTLMEIDDFGKRLDTLEEMDASGWRYQDIIPMAGNLQIVFYRPEGSRNAEDVLVKCLLNEREVRLPVTPVTGPYYRWTDLRKYYLDKLKEFSMRNH